MKSKLYEIKIVEIKILGTMFLLIFRLKKKTLLLKTSHKHSKNDALNDFMIIL